MRCFNIKHEKVKFNLSSSVRVSLHDTNSGQNIGISSCSTLFFLTFILGWLLCSLSPRLTSFKFSLMPSFCAYNTWLLNNIYGRFIENFSNNRLTFDNFVFSIQLDGKVSFNFIRKIKLCGFSITFHYLFHNLLLIYIMASVFLGKFIFLMANVVVGFAF